MALTSADSRSIFLMSIMQVELADAPQELLLVHFFPLHSVNFTIQGQGGTFCDEAWLVAGEGDFAKFFLPQVLCLSLEDMAL